MEQTRCRFLLRRSLSISQCISSRSYAGTTSYWLIGLIGSATFFRILPANIYTSSPNFRDIDYSYVFMARKLRMCQK